MRYRRLTYSYQIAVSHAARPTETAWRPLADVYETPSGVSVTVELAGVDPEDMDVLFFENALVLEGRRHLPVLDPVGFFQRAEIRRGQFRLEIGLPASVEPEPTEVRFEQGILFLRLAKSGQPTARY